MITILLAGGAAWFALATGVAVVLGRAIRAADLTEGTSDR